MGDLRQGLEVEVEVGVEVQGFMGSGPIELDW
jgi:hypothetical protein